MKKLTPTERLNEIRDILEDVDRHCGAVDGPKIPISQEIAASEWCKIYELAKGELVLNPLCQHCNRTIVENCVYVEDIGCVREITRIDNGILIVEIVYKTEGFDDHKHSNPRLFCRSCDTTIELADDQKIEFV